MMWQDFVFMGGSLLSVIFLYPTLRDASSKVPRATSVPSMLIGAAYASTFTTLDMTFSAVGAFAACTMWLLIALLRGPGSAPTSRFREVHSALAERYRRTVLGYAPTDRSSDRQRYDEGDVSAAPHGD